MHLTSKFRTRPDGRCAWCDHHFPGAVLILTKRPRRVHGGQVLSLRRLTRQATHPISTLRTRHAIYIQKSASASASTKRRQTKGPDIQTRQHPPPCDIVDQPSRTRPSQRGSRSVGGAEDARALLTARKANIEVEIGNKIVGRLNFQNTG